MYVVEYYARPTQYTEFSTFPGFFLRGAFFKILKDSDPNIATQIHESKKIAPYSIKPLEELNSNKVVFNKIKANVLTRFSFIFLKEDLYERFRDKFLIESFSISDKPFIIHEIKVRRISFKDLEKSIQELPRKFSIDFLTPTAFRLPVTSCCKHCHVYKRLKMRTARKDKETIDLIATIKNRRGVTYPLPDIKLLFYNTIKILEVYEQIDFDLESFNDWLDLESIVISGFEEGIRTMVIYEHKTSKKFFKGFIGKVNFAFRHINEKYMRIAYALLKYGEIINVGSNRTAGCGMIKLLY
jgi:CRISPR/Cas system endoribonuclease Cas6 (RAMP superfamily)